MPVYDLEHAAEAAKPVTYTVEKGDCLWAIAKQFYGTGAKFGDIAAANSIADPALIYPGQVLVIPNAK